MFNFMQKTFTSLQATTLYEMGFLNLEWGNYQTAIEYFTRVIEFDSKHADAFYERGVAFGKLGNQSEAMNDFHKAIQLNSKLIDDLYNAGKDSLESEQYQTAIVYFTCVIELDAEHVDPRDAKRANAFYKRGIAFKKMGEQQKATSDFQQAVQLNPKLLDFIRDPQAQAHYDNALLNPQSIKKLLRRGITTYQLGGRYHQALIDFNKVLQLNPNHALALYHRGMVRFELGNYESAEANFRASIRNQDDNADVYIMLAIVKQMQKDPSANYSIENAYKLIQEKKKLIKMLELCISSEYYKNDVAEKIVDLETALNNETYSRSPLIAMMALGYYYLGRAYQMKGEFTQAEQNFLQSIKTAENSMLSYEYANFLVQQGKIGLAIPQLLHALKLSTDGKCVTYYTLCPPLLSLSKELQEEIMHSYRLSIRVSVVATWQLIYCYIAVDEKSNAEQQLNNLLKAVEEFPSPLAYSLQGYACQSLKQWYLAARSFKTAVLLRANYSLAQQNLQKCLNQLSVQEDEIEPFEIIAQIQQFLVSENSEPVKQEQENTIRSINSSQLSDNKKQEIDKQTATATERSKLNPKQHSGYESMTNRTSAEANSVNEIKSATYYEFYQLTDSHQSGEQLLKLPMEEFVSNQNQKSPQQKSETETETALPLVQNLPNQSEEESKKEPDDGQDNYLQYS